MALTVNHAFSCLIPDDPASAAAGEVVPSDWNASHSLTGRADGTQLMQGQALSVLGVASNAVADQASIVAATDKQVMRRSGTSIGFGAIDVSSAAAVTGTLSVANGGTGAGSFTAGCLLIGNGTAAVATDANLVWDAINVRAGIGVASRTPQAALDVDGSVPILTRSSANLGPIFWSSGTFNGFRIQVKDTTSTPYIAFDTGATTPNIVDSSNQKAYIKWTGATSTLSIGTGASDDTWTLDAGQITHKKVTRTKNDITTSGKGSKVYWGVTDAQDLSLLANNLECLVLKTSGFVGIGTNAPNTALTIAGDVTPKVTGTNNLGSATYAWKQLFLDYTNTATVGDVTMNKASGTVNLAALGTTLTLTNSLIATTSRIMLTLASNPGANVGSLYAVPAAGSCTINVTTAVTNQTKVAFQIIN